MAQALTRAAASAPPVTHDDSDDEALDHAVALELQRFYEAQYEQETEDEIVAYSLTLEQARRLHENQPDDADDFAFDDFDVVEVSTTDGKPPPHCASCLGELPQAPQRRVLPCGHVYCVACITVRVKIGVRDRSLVPAHCCSKEYPTEYIKEVLSRDELATYERFVDEQSWTRHGQFQLVSDAEYAAAVKRQGWKQCPRCGVGVEKLSGCDAMRCLRGHLFCWACAHAPCQCGLTNLQTYGYRG